MPSAWLFSVLVAVRNTVFREWPLEICELLLHTLSPFVISSLVVPREQSFDFWMFNMMRFWPVCLAVYILDCSLTGLSPTADWHHCLTVWHIDCSLFWYTWSLFSHSFCCQYRTGKKKNQPTYISPQKFSPLWDLVPAFPIVKSAHLPAMPCRQNPMVTVDHGRTTRSDIWK